MIQIIPKNHGIFSLFRNFSESQGLYIGRKLFPGLYRAFTLALKCAFSLNVRLNSYHANRHSNFSIPKRIKILTFQQKILKKRKNSMVFQNYLNYNSLNSRFDDHKEKKIVNKQQVYKPYRHESLDIGRKLGIFPSPSRAYIWKGRLGIFPSLEVYTVESIPS